MNKNAHVLQRFEELSNKAELILKDTVTVSILGGQNTYDAVKGADVLGWVTNALNLLQRIFGEESIHFQNLSEYSTKIGSNFEKNAFTRLIAVFKAARDDYEGGYLFNFQSLVKAEVCDDMLDQAKALLDAGYKDPACVVAGVVLETTLKELCLRHLVTPAKMNRMNDDLAKKGIYNKGMQKQILAWADRRNSAAHGDWEAYSKDDVKDMIEGVTRFMANYL